MAKKIEYMRQVKAYIDSAQQSMIRVPVDVARILQNAGWASDYVFLSYDFKADRIVISKTPRGWFDVPVACPSPFDVFNQNGT